MFIPDTQARCGNFEDVVKELSSARGAGGGGRGSGDPDYNPAVHDGATRTFLVK